MRFCYNDPISTHTHMTAAALQDALFGTVAGYSLSSAGKSRIGREGDPALTYGECTPEAVEHILQVVDAQPGEVFYDLGSGTGKMVVYAAFFVPLKKSVGIELLPELHEAAQDAGCRYDQDVRPHLADDRRHTELDFRIGDIFDADLSDGDIIVSHCCTCFDDALMQKLSDRLETCAKPGARIVTITRGLSAPCFEPIGCSPCQMGWGQATVNAYRKR